MNDEDKTVNKVQKRATLHEKAVQAIASGEVARQPTQARKAPQKRPQQFSYQGVVDPLAMKAAREIINGVGQWEGRGYTKIDVLAEDTVIVR